MVRRPKEEPLALHVASHQCTVCVVVLEEGNQSSGNADHLATSDVNIFDLRWWHNLEVAAVPGDQARARNQCTALVGGNVGWSDIGIGLFVGAKPYDFIGDSTFRNLAVRSDQETVFVDPA